MKILSPFSYFISKLSTSEAASEVAHVNCSAVLTTIESFVKYVIYFGIFCTRSYIVLILG